MDAAFNRRHTASNCTPALNESRTPVDKCGQSVYAIVMLKLVLPLVALLVAGLLLEMCQTASADGDVVGKVVAGYQGWFACAGDGTPVGGGLNRWVHWAGGAAPSPGHQSFELWPDVREFGTEHTYQTGYANLGNGQPAKLFSSDQAFTVNTHVKWMRDYGIDCAALQRFGSELGDPVYARQRNGVAALLRDAGEKNGRKFYIMYDVSGWKDFPEKIKADWTNTVTGSLHLTASRAYAKQNNKPVVCLWGFGFTDRPGDASQCRDVIQWFQNQGCYVIGGVPASWRDGNRDSKPGFLDVYTAFNMIQPWTVGRFKGTDGADDYKTKFLVPDAAFCKAHGMDYQPVVFPGFAWSNWNGGPRNAIPRLHGDFLWRQFANLRESGITSAYVAMFDEFDEGTAIAKAAEDASMIPTNQYFLTLDADGTHVSSDFYLRVTRDGGRMLAGKTPLNRTRPTPFTAEK